MSIEGVSYTGTNTTTTATASDNTSLDQVDFLTLLTTQLEYQDPTNPVDNSEMINQMTSYSMLDEDVQQNANLEKIINQLDALSSMSTSNYIGQDVLAPGGVITSEDGEVSSIVVNLEEDAATVGLNIYNSDGALVDTQYFSDVSSGGNVFDGTMLNSSGVLDTAGTYLVEAFAYDENEAEVGVYLQSTGTVTEVNQDDLGKTQLTLKDGREVSLTDVDLVS